MTDDRLDPRLNAYRPDLAAAELKGRVDAARFVAGTCRQVKHGLAELRRAPAAGAELTSQLLGGEVVTVYDETDGWAWVQNQTDGYVGYTPAAALSAELRQPSHVVKVLRSFVYPEPDMKAPPLDVLGLSGSAAVTGETAEFCALAGGGWVYGRHLAPLDEPALDYVATAIEFLGAPYLWGGKTSLGLDCSALVQVALNRAGHPCPRDSDMQAESLGEARPADAPPERGDLVFVSRHVAIALDDWRILHATAHDMLVAIEPLADLVARAERLTGRGITALRRPVMV
ncbi:MAG: C40 family peptidase [Rhodospirillales bacterium]|nr:C40 family peptidase [Rhodospirillales bacterium]MDH3912084.1 C40 family peptidase [Rhodospirillales bacterium]MDH3919203.1 C40 family peptidase [Rhodospirillales bacterium]MDH3968906.1 C40 family peptidase [Rhodospirillales bacterium]